MVVVFVFSPKTVFAYRIDLAALRGQKCNHTLCGTRTLFWGFSVAVRMPLARRIFASVAVRMPLARRIFAKGYRPSRKFFSLADSNQEAEEYGVVAAAGGRFFLRVDGRQELRAKWVAQVFVLVDKVVVYCGVCIAEAPQGRSSPYLLPVCPAGPFGKRCGQEVWWIGAAWYLWWGAVPRSAVRVRIWCPCAPQGHSAR